MPFWISLIFYEFIFNLLCREDDKIAKKFILQPWLENDDTETEFLRKVCETLLIALLPKEYACCHTLRRLLREILTSAGDLEFYSGDGTKSTVIK